MRAIAAQRLLNASRVKIPRIAAVLVMFAATASVHAGELVASARVGAVMPGLISPYSILLTRTSVAPYVGVDAGISWAYFQSGAYLQVAPMSGPPTLHGVDQAGRTSYTVVSVGTSPRVQLPLGDDFLVLRLGLHLGLNFTIGHAEFSKGTVLDTVGWGIDSGPTLEAAFRVSSFMRVVVQGSFFSQLAGATLSASNGKQYAYPFAPFVFLAVGPEFTR